MGNSTWREHRIRKATTVSSVKTLFYKFSTSGIILLCDKFQERKMKKLLIGILFVGGLTSVAFASDYYGDDGQNHYFD